MSVRDTLVSYSSRQETVPLRSKSRIVREYVIVRYGLCKGEIPGVGSDSSVKGSTGKNRATPWVGTGGANRPPRPPGAVVTMTLYKVAKCLII